MKVAIVVCSLAVICLAEPPPSLSYLPPSPKQGYKKAGYQSTTTTGLPQIVAARNFDKAAQGTARDRFGFGRNPTNFVQMTTPTSRLAVEQQGYSETAAAYAAARNSLEQLNTEPANYNFGYMVNDNEQGTDFGHFEERQNEAAHGMYHVLLPDGRKQTVSYEADERGFKPRISYEDAESMNGGYDENANTVSQNGGKYNNGASGNY